MIQYVLPQAVKVPTPCTFSQEEVRMIHTHNVFEIADWVYVNNVTDFAVIAHYGRSFGDLILRVVETIYSD